MDLTKEIELIILDRIVQKAEITEKDFDHFFEEKNFEYNITISRIIRAQLDLIPEISNEFVEIRRRILQRERNMEEAAREIKGSLLKHAVIVKTSTRFLIIVSFITILAAFFLIRMDSKIHPLPGPIYRTVLKK
jgi:hypothetical protein